VTLNCSSSMQMYSCVFLKPCLPLFHCFLILRILLEEWGVDSIRIVLYLNGKEWELLIFLARLGVLNSGFCDGVSGVPKTREVLCKIFFFFVCVWIQLIWKRVQDFHHILSMIHTPLRLLNACVLDQWTVRGVYCHSALFSFHRLAKISKEIKQQFPNWT